MAVSLLVRIFELCEGNTYYATSSTSVRYSFIPNCILDIQSLSCVTPTL